jgi:hypothetical protein
MVSKQGFEKTRRTSCLIRYQQDPIRGGCPSAQVEGFVMEDAQGKSVVFLIWTLCLVPSDMCRFQCDRDATQPQMESADCTPVFVGSQYSQSKQTIPWSSPNRWEMIESYCDQNVGVD